MRPRIIIKRPSPYELLLELADLGMRFEKVLLYLLVLEAVLVGHH